MFDPSLALYKPSAERFLANNPNDREQEGIELGFRTYLPASFLVIFKGLGHILLATVPSSLF